MKMTTTQAICCWDSKRIIGFIVPEAGKKDYRWVAFYADRKCNHGVGTTVAKCRAQIEKSRKEEVEHIAFIEALDSGDDD